jgi:hypothetical protein
MLVRRAMPALLLLLVTSGFLGYYNYRVFGNALTLPYKINRAQYASAPHFVFQSARAVPAYRHKVMQDFYTGLELRWFKDMQTPLGFLRKTVRKAGTATLFYLGVLLFPPLMLLPKVLLDRRMRFLVITGGIGLIGLLVETWFIPHYAAPFTAGIYALLLQCMRHMRICKPRGRCAGLFLVRVTPGICVLLVVLRLIAGPLHIQLPAVKSLNPYGSQLAGLARTGIEKQLESYPGGQLAIVRYSPDHDTYGEWVYNAADIDNSKVVWAHEMGPMKDHALLSYYKDRSVWLVEPDCDPPRVSPIKNAADSRATQGTHDRTY